VSAATVDADDAYCDALLRRDDRDRWLACLFAPPAVRRHWHALYAFNLEVARIREVVSEPLLGEIRLQWWCEALEGTRTEDVQANPVAAALLRLFAQNPALSCSLALKLLDARIFDLYDDPMPTVAALEAYAIATSASLFRLAAGCLDAGALERLGATIDHAGIAYALTGLLRALPWHAARGQLYIPLEMLDAHGVAPHVFGAGHMTPAIEAVLADMRGLAHRHLAAAYAGLRGVDSSAAAFLPLSLCAPYLRLMEKPGFDPFMQPIALPQWRRQWILWRAARRLR